ncbi:PREDICTED: mannose-6-phosphate isomerase 1 [Prunus mume]|uniref:mannose-6-phosphate isomerase n=1 Tax=Prunus mume TaxID=102107 RepID=A0ABM0PU51_PRUMU|nr:PREDICTED: mannose-6-phosphate isomerase 1 [Prunus mume]
MESIGKSMKHHNQKSSLQRLRCSVQNYDWGKRGTDSLVARLSALNSSSEIDPEKPYAEIWMGTHESGPSFLIQNGDENNGFLSIGSESLSLKDWVLENPKVLGEKVVQKWGSDLPFLFKVLSVAKALSIQAHPDKELAKVLHKFMPNLYKDANHKPEMALAVTHFEALCGFISLEELKVVLDNVPEIEELVGSEDANKVFDITDRDDENKVTSVLRSIFTHLMSASKEMITTIITKMKNRLRIESQGRLLTEKEQLVLQLERQYPADVGVISAFFLNHVNLKPGEALYIGANEPHAYIFGECIECMATSDNVVRAGLTPKHMDVNTLCSMLTYKQGYPKILQGVALGPYVTRYLPPFDEFEVDCCQLPQGESAEFPAVPGPSIFVVTFGEGIIYASDLKGDIITEGDVLFAPANTQISITSASQLQIYRAGVNSMFFQAS